MGDELARYVKEALERAWAANRGTVGRVADVIAASYLAGHRIYAFGSGHSHLLVEEMYYRAGGLTIVTPIWDPALMLHEDAPRSSQLEQTPGYSKTIVSRLGWQDGDVLWVISNSGRNPLIVEMALEARARGVTVVALTSLTHAQAVAAMSVTGQKLHEVADWVLDNGGAVGDAGFYLQGFERPLFPTSTVVGAALVNWVWVEVAGRLRDAGHSPDVVTSFNVDAAG
jgi:uncharacterized phosphosugar-binding protein